MRCPTRHHGPNGNLTAISSGGVNARDNQLGTRHFVYIITCSVLYVRSQSVVYAVHMDDKIVWRNMLPHKHDYGMREAEEWRGTDVCDETSSSITSHTRMWTCSIYCGQQGHVVVICVCHKLTRTNILVHKHGTHPPWYTISYIDIYSTRSIANHMPDAHKHTHRLHTGQPTDERPTRKFNKVMNTRCKTGAPASQHRRVTLVAAAQSN